MATDKDLALLSVNAYFSQRDFVNRVGIPDGWALLGNNRIPVDASGFEAAAYTNGTEIVIAYTGTDQAIDWATNIAAGFGTWPTDQMLKAAAFYQKIKADYGGAISFTGHSLGGGLAALMGVFFNKTAVTFDPAPFRQSASNSSRDAIKADLAALRLIGLRPYFSFYFSFRVKMTPSPIPILATRLLGKGNDTFAEPANDANYENQSTRREA